MQVDKFIERWTKSIEQGSAGVFLGAGLSKRAGYKDWRKLLADIANELGLDIESENDLAAVAQYSLNRSAGKRNRLTQLIVDHFPPKDAPEPFRILARLPIRHILTTNYDKLAESAWHQERRLLDVKSRSADLGREMPWAHSILYKMHGSIDHPSDVVIAKDDYELYRRDRAGFLQLLSGHLVSKQMLFLGFSFTDPNLSHLFANIREVFQSNGPEHYAIVRRPQKGTGAGAARRFQTEKVRHTLWVEDLQRYGIQCVEIDKYEDVDEILRQVELKLAGRSVFISGSFPSDLMNDERRYVEEVAREVGRLIVDQEKRLVSGFGRVVGSAALAGALGGILSETAPNLEKSLLLRPFPHKSPAGTTPVEFKRKYRDGMIQQAGICVFICGLRQAAGQEPAVSEGVLDEFESAKRLGRVTIPIGATGGAAARIWKDMSEEAGWTACGLTREDFERLNQSMLPPNEVVKIIRKAMAQSGKTSVAKPATKRK